MPTLAQKIDALLPQTQCTQCGFEGCLPYAEAIAAGEAEINRCPPGGDTGLQALAALLNRPLMALDASRGPHLPHRIAVIDEAACIGCAKCLKACPTDAIIGANKMMHSVIAELCTGCDLCIPPCPVDCIEMAADASFPKLTSRDVSRERFSFHQFRLARDFTERQHLLAEKERAVLRKL